MHITKIVQEVAGDDLTAVKISEVALQGVETKVSLIEIKYMRAGRQTYKEREGADPEKGEAPTREQASAFIVIITMKGSIYTYGLRLIWPTWGQTYQTSQV